MISRKLIIIGAVIASSLVLAGCKGYGTSTTSQNKQQQPATNQNAVATNVITYSDSGFTPSEVKAKVSEAVTIKNDSASTVQVNSDPHPTHTLFPELNLGAIGAGESKSVTFSKAGTYTFHNHLKASEKGTIVVE